MPWEIVIGLETHAQLSTASKMFSGAPGTWRSHFRKYSGLKYGRPKKSRM